MVNCDSLCLLFCNDNLVAVTLQLSCCESDCKSARSPLRWAAPPLMIRATTIAPVTSSLLIVAPCGRGSMRILCPNTHSAHCTPHKPHTRFTISVCTKLHHAHTNVERTPTGTVGLASKYDDKFVHFWCPTEYQTHFVFPASHLVLVHTLA